MDISSVEETLLPFAVRCFLSNPGKRSLEIGPFLSWQSVFKRRKWVSHNPWKPENNNWQWHFTAAVAALTGDGGEGNGCRCHPRANLSGSRHLTSRPVWLKRWSQFGEISWLEDGKEEMKKLQWFWSIDNKREQQKKCLFLKTLALLTKHLHPGIKMAPFSWPNTYRKTSFNQTRGKYFTYGSLYCFNVLPKQPWAVTHPRCFQKV